jgi:hypothetical protein
MPLQQLAIQEGMAMRSPYLHPHSIELLTQLPPILEDGLQKKALAEHFLHHYLKYQSPLASSPTQTAPTASLREREASDLLRALLSPEALKNRGIFEPQAVEKLLQQPNNAETNNALVLVFTTQLLCQLFQVES